MDLTIEPVVINKSNTGGGGDIIEFEDKGKQTDRHGCMIDLTPVKCEKLTE